MDPFQLITYVGLLVGSNVFWAWHCHKLINKLMSRSYLEYVEGGLTKEKLKAKIEEPKQDFYDDREFDSLSELTT